MISTLLSKGRPPQLTENWTAVRSGNTCTPSVCSLKCRRFNQFTPVQKLDSGLRNGQGMRTVLASVTAALLLLSPLPVAADSSATMNVSVRVVARATVTVDAPAEVEVTAADLARGYVEIPAIQLRVRTNSPNGCLLQASKTDDAFASVEVAFGNTTMTVAQESWVSRPYSKGGETMMVNMRARLAPGASAGRYTLPVHFSASAM